MLLEPGALQRQLEAAFRSLARGNGKRKIAPAEIEQGGKRSTNTGRVTEVFVNQNGKWVNPSWHMDIGK